MSTPHEWENEMTFEEFVKKVFSRADIPEWAWDAVAPIVSQHNSFLSRARAEGVEEGLNLRREYNDPELLKQIEMKADRSGYERGLREAMEVVGAVDEYSIWTELLIENNFANEGDRDFAWEKYDWAKHELSRVLSALREKLDRAGDK